MKFTKQGVLFEGYFEVGGRGSQQPHVVMRIGRALLIRLADHLLQIARE